MSEKLRVYSVSYANGSELVGGVYEDLDKALSALLDMISDMGDEDPWGNEYNDIVESITIGEWSGANTYIIGSSGLCSIHAFKTNLKLG